MQAKFRHGVQVAYLAGNHITPVAVDVQWQAGEVFSPIDAIAQWLKQEWNQNINRDNLRLEQVILHWLHRQLSQAKVAV